MDFRFIMYLSIQIKVNLYLNFILKFIFKLFRLNIFFYTSNRNLLIISKFDFLYVIIFIYLNRFI